MVPDLSRMIADLTAMVGIRSVNPYDDPPTPGFREAEMADFLISAMDRMGLETGRDEILPGRPNVWGRMRGTGGGATLMLAGHMDTVGTATYDGDPFRAEIHAGRLYGRGAVDMKGPLCAMLEAARMVKGSGLQGDLLLMFVADEEHRMIGSVAAGHSGPKADFCITCEPTMLAIANAHKGQSAFPITIAGKAAHSSRPELDQNALTGAARLITAIQTYDARLQNRPAHPLLGFGRATPVLIEGGESHSAVPGQAILTVDRRTLPSEASDLIREELASLIADAGVDAKIGQPEPNVPGLETDSASPIVRSTLVAAASVGGASRPIAFPGSTDAPNFGCPAVICGPGDLAQAHTDDEYISLDQLEKAAVLYAMVAGDLLGPR